MRSGVDTAVRALIIVRDKILVETVRDLGIVFLPGGRVDSGETQRATLARELREEIAGIELEIGDYLGEIDHSWTTKSDVHGRCLNHFFLCSVIAGETESVRARESGRELTWVRTGGADLASLKPPSLLSKIANPLDGAPWKITDIE